MTIVKSKEKFIDDNDHLILKSGHPSPLSANKGYWFGNNHFKKCNEFLIFFCAKSFIFSWKVSQ